MSVFWLLIQFFLLGLMEGLASKGLEKFVSNHVSKSMRRYGLIFSNFVTGLGKFFSIPFVLLFKSWFKETINTSHLDRYYLALAILSSVFLFIYLCVLPIYAGMEYLLEGMESDDRGLEDVTLDWIPTCSRSHSHLIERVYINKASIAIWINNICDQ